MLKKSLLLLLPYLPFSASGAEFEFSLGAGLQYSGVIGTQFAIKHQDSKYFVAVGLPGYSIGMQTIISDNEKHSAGFTLGDFGGVYGGGFYYGLLTYNYHLSDFKNSGWVFGAGIGAHNEESYNSRTNRSKTTQDTMLS